MTTHLFDPTATSPDDEEYRAEVRHWCSRNIPKDWRKKQTGISSEEFVSFQSHWFQLVRDARYAIPHWPHEWGGGLSLERQLIIFKEFAIADAPRLVLNFVSIHHAASTLFVAGSTEQRQRHLPAILNGEIWCQGFSEPNAGSDLASLETRANREGDNFIVNGQKVWVSLAMYADWCLLLARTDPSAPKRKGISFLLLDMNSPGVEVRPIRQATGESHFAEMFLTNVKVPATNLVGQENEGWSVANATLGAERGLTIVELTEQLSVGYDSLIDLASSTYLSTGSMAIKDDWVRERLAVLGTDVTALRLLCKQLMVDIDVNHATNTAASVIKLVYSELLQRLTSFGLSLQGMAAQHVVDKPMSSGWMSESWMLDYVGSWEWTIPAGTSEIQRSIIGERILGLPRDPSVS